MNTTYLDPLWDKPPLVQAVLPFLDRKALVGTAPIPTLDVVLHSHQVGDLVRRGNWQDRPDQVVCLQELLTLDENIAFEAPTGSGKTNVGLLVARSHAKKIGKPDVLLVVPHVDLLPQHAWSASHFFSIESSNIVQVSGSIDTQANRAKLYAQENISLLCITPETLLNDLDAKIRSLDLTRFGAVVIDECHHARGDHPLGLLVDRLVATQKELKLVALSATFAETQEARDLLRQRLGRAHYVYGAMKAGDRSAKGYLAQPSALLVRAGQELEVGILKSVDFLRDALFHYPAIERDVAKLHQDVRGLLLTQSYPYYENLRKRIQSIVPKGWERHEMEAHLWAIQTLSSFYEMLIHGGRFRFLDAFGRNRAASIYGIEEKKQLSPETASPDTAIAKKRKAPTSGWIFRLAQRIGSLRGFWSSIDETLKLVVPGSPYKFLRAFPKGISELETLAGLDAASLPRSRGSPQAQLERRIDTVFDRLRSKVAETPQWSEHAKLDQFRRAVRELRGRDELSGKVLVRTALVSDAFFLAEICSKQLGLRAEAVVSGAHLSPTRRAARLAAFKNGELDVLVGTSLLDEGHDLDKAIGIILYDPVPSGRTRIQVQGRVGRLNASGEVIQIVAQAPRELLTYHIGRAREAKIRGLHE